MAAVRSLYGGAGRSSFSPRRPSIHLIHLIHMPVSRLRAPTTYEVVPAAAGNPWPWRLRAGMFALLFCVVLVLAAHIGLSAWVISNLRPIIRLLVVQTLGQPDWVATILEWIFAGSLTPVVASAWLASWVPGWKFDPWRRSSGRALAALFVLLCLSSLVRRAADLDAMGRPNHVHEILELADDAAFDHRDEGKALVLYEIDANGSIHLWPTTAQKSPVTNQRLEPITLPIITRWRAQEREKKDRQAAEERARINAQQQAAEQARELEQARLEEVAERQRQREREERARLAERQATEAASIAETARARQEQERVAREEEQHRRALQAEQLAAQEISSNPVRQSPAKLPANRSSDAVTPHWNRQKRSTDRSESSALDSISRAGNALENSARVDTQPFYFFNETFPAPVIACPQVESFRTSESPRQIVERPRVVFPSTVTRTIRVTQMPTYSTPPLIVRVPVSRAAPPRFDFRPVPVQRGYFPQNRRILTRPTFPPGAAWERRRNFR